MKEKIEIKISTDFIKLDQFLKFAGLVATGGEAKNIINDNYILVNGEETNQRGKKLRKGDTVSIKDYEDEFLIV